MLERLFTAAFRGLVYPQIWEDPVVDLERSTRPNDRVIAIASGGCNALSYLTADPAEIVAVDLNGAHVALGRLKLAALRHLPDYDAFLRFFGRADSRANVRAYDTLLRHRARSGHPRLLGRAAISAAAGASRCSRAISTAYGLLGQCIGAGHALARLHGVDPGVILTADSLAEQRGCSIGALRRCSTSRRCAG